WGEERIVAETRGLSVVLAVDISRSMLAEDATPNRLRRALREARRLIQDLDGDRVGLIAFAGSSYILSPLSIDGSALTLYLDALDPDMASQGGTGLAPALRQAGAVRDFVASFRRARANETRTEQSRPRAWLPLMLAVVLLVVQAASRRTAALVGLTFACLTAPGAGAQQPQLPRSPAEKAWD